MSLRRKAPRLPSYAQGPATALAPGMLKMPSSWASLRWEGPPCERGPATPCLFIPSGDYAVSIQPALPTCTPTSFPHLQPPYSYQKLLLFSRSCNARYHSTRVLHIIKTISLLVSLLLPGSQTLRALLRRWWTCVFGGLGICQGSGQTGPEW